MPYNRPTPQQILDRLQLEIDQLIPNADSKLRFSVESVLAKTTSMAAHELYGYIQWVSQQILPDTAEQEILERHSAIWGIARKQASPAKGSVTFTGINNVVIPAGTLLKNALDQQYSTDSDATVLNGSVTVDVTAQTKGSLGNASASSNINLASPISGIQSQGSVASNGLNGGSDIETDASLRARLIARIQQPPHGGALFDYEQWALDVPGVTRAWPYENQYGLGTVAVLFVMDDKAPDPIPSALEVEDVQNYIDTVRPTGADVTVVAPTAQTINFEIHLNPNTTIVQNAIKAELEDFLRREAKPGGTLYLSRIQEVISIAAGEFNHVLVSPSANVVSSFGQMPTAMTFTWGAL